MTCRTDYKCEISCPLPLKFLLLKAKVRCSMKNYDEISGYNSERKSGGGLFKAVMTLSLAGGAFVYFKAAGYADFFAAGCGYVIIGLFCLLAAAGQRAVYASRHEGMCGAAAPDGQRRFGSVRCTAAA